MALAAVARAQLGAALDSAEAIAAVHSLTMPLDGTLAHADISLRQFMVTRSGRLRLADFGRVRLLTPASGGLRQGSRFCGGSPKLKDLHQAEEREQEQAREKRSKICSGFELLGIENGTWAYHKTSKNDYEFDGLPLFANAFFDGDREKAKEYELVSIVFPIFALSLDCLLGNVRAKRN